jgi:hypothetical protein
MPVLQSATAPVDPSLRGDAGVTEAKELRRLRQLEQETFFTDNDIWRLHNVDDDRLCADCAGYTSNPLYLGGDLLATFPYLIITGLDTIDANIHRNCRCFLTREDWNIPFLAK